MNDTATLVGAILAALAIVATSVGGLIWIVKFLLTQFRKTLEANTKALSLNTRATKNADNYLRERNGRDNEFHAQVLKSLEKLPIQKVKEQRVEHQTIKEVD